MADRHFLASLGQCKPAETLTIIGATTRAAAQSARRACFLPVAADLFGDLDLQEVAPTSTVSDYPGGFENAIAGSQPGGWIYTGGLENYPNLIERWQSLRPLLGNPAEVLREVRNPARVADCLRRANLPCPAVGDEPRGLPRNGTWLQKPLRSAAGMHIERWTHASTTNQEHALYYQEHISGASVSAAFLAAGRRAILLGATQQLLGGSSFRYAGSVGPLPMDKETAEQWNAIGQSLAAEFDLVGLFGVDAVVNERGIWPVEINPRYTASMEVIEAALKQSLIALHVAACRDKQLPIIDPPNASLVYGKQICFADQALTVEIDLRTRFSDIADIPQINTKFMSGDPITTFLRTGRTASAVLESLSSAIADCQKTLKQSATITRTQSGLR